MSHANKTLLPIGFEDLIAPRVGHAHQILVDIMATFTSFDYTLVEPPLLEYEESLLAAPDAPKSQDIFRFIDPISHRTIGVRGDITLQVVRLAKDHLSDAPRPLRLAYYGHVLRIANTALRPQRQYMQLGLEQIGGDAHAEVEVLQVALEALHCVGVRDICLDFVLPTLVRRYIANIPENSQKILAARNIGSIKQQIRDSELNSEIGKVLEFLLLLPPNPANALEQLSHHQAFSDDHALFGQLRSIMSTIRSSHPDVLLSLDLIEQYGFTYKTGIAYNLYAKGQNTSLGRGGRYQADTEPACGVSLNLNNLLVNSQPSPSTKKLLIPYNTDFKALRLLRADGWTVVFSDTPESQFGVQHYYRNGAIHSFTSS
ncbi:MAG: ATP phosphoribosyltransferase regulatory subunit [Alphaproteobacteria bacterium]|nr:ATP phosphoribosyltransferase regulatory subunit [Alphaproteobacteria bacterium]